MATATVQRARPVAPPVTSVTLVLSPDEASFVRTVLGGQNQANVFKRNGKTSPASTLKDTVYGALGAAGVESWNTSESWNPIWGR